MVNGFPIVAIFDTGSSGVVISKLCIRRLGLVPDDEVEFNITSATNSSKKICKLFHQLKIEVANISCDLPVIVLEGLHFDLLLGVNWLTEVNAVIDVKNSKLIVKDKTVNCDYWPEPSSFKMAAISLFSAKVAVEIPPLSKVEIPIKHDVLDKKGIFFVSYCYDKNLVGDFFVQANEDSLVPNINLKNISKNCFSVQVGQNLGSFSRTEDFSLNKLNISSYIVIKSLNLVDFLLHLSPEWLSKWHDLLTKWYNVLSKNKYDVGLTRAEYKI